ncbi:MAG: hypothetical protein RR771_10700 [Acinetobacter sp.]
MKISIILAILGFITLLVFWGDKSGTSIPSDTSSSEFKLLLTGENIKEEKAFRANHFYYQLSAFANDPLSHIYWHNNENTISGDMRVSPNSPNAHIDFFETDPLKFYRQRYWKIQSNLSASTSVSKTSYNITGAGHQHKSIQLNIKQPNSLYSTILNIRPQFVEFTGSVSIKAPANWAIFQSHRFPVLPVQGQLTFNGENYHLVDINFGLSPLNASNGINYDFTFKHQDKTLTIFYNQATTNAPRNLTFQHDYEIYELELKTDDPRWQETTQEIKVNLSPVTMKTINNKATGKISVQLTIPKNHAQLKANNQPLTLLLGNSTLFATTNNNEKSYALVFALGEENLTLSINQIGQHPFYLSYYEDSTEFSCGNGHMPCSGLSISEDKKTFTFNDVKLGKYNLNGQLFIAGVL